MGDEWIMSTANLPTVDVICRYYFTIDLRHLDGEPIRLVECVHQRRLVGICFRKPNEADIRVAIVMIFLGVMVDDANL